MKFTKMQGCGNDYIYINGFVEKIEEEEKESFIKSVSDRHFGIGGDGVIFIQPCEEADFEMEMYNADGSRGEMCGNGIRCVGKYVYDRGLTKEKNITVLSGGKVKLLEMTTDSNDKVTSVKVNMGSPILEPQNIPVNMEGEWVVDRPIVINNIEQRITCVSMGNPHAVVFMKDIDKLKIEQIGPLFENHPIFPKRINTEFVEVINRKLVKMRVWERGSGETLACGTGCCATVVACVLNCLTEEEITVKLLGGELQVRWDRDKNVVYMSGPAEFVFDGEI